jgi:hypothetical protein
MTIYCTPDLYSTAALLHMYFAVRPHQQSNRIRYTYSSSYKQGLGRER